jgi:uncharacterized membrane protein YbjE (DUF340 family)
LQSFGHFSGVILRLFDNYITALSAPFVGSFALMSRFLREILLPMVFPSHSSILGPFDKKMIEINIACTLPVVFPSFEGHSVAPPL